MNLEKLTAYEMGLFEFEVLGPALRQLIEDEGYKIKNILEVAEIPRATLYHFFNGDRDLPSGRLFRVLEAMHLSTDDLIQQIHRMHRDEEADMYLSAFSNFQSLSPKMFEAQLEDVPLLQLTDILITLAAIIRLQIADESDRDQLLKVIVNIAQKKIFGRVGKMTLSEMELFNNILPNFPYEQAVVLYFEMEKSIQDRLDSLQTSIDLNYGSRMLNIFANLTFNMGLTALQHEDTELFAHILAVAENRKIPYYDWNGRLIKYALDILSLYQAGKVSEAEALYAKIVETVDFMIAPEQQLMYRQILEENFETFVAQVKR